MDQLDTEKKLQEAVMLDDYYNKTAQHMRQGVGETPK